MPSCGNAFTKSNSLRGGVLLMGGLWPSVVAVLVGAGFGQRREKETYDLSRFGGGEEEAGESRPGVTAQDMDDLAKLNASLESSIGPGQGGGGDNGESAEPAKPVRTLLADERPAAVSREEEEEKDYQGEWYPVARKARREE